MRMLLVALLAAFSAQLATITYHQTHHGAAAADRSHASEWRAEESCAICDGAQTSASPSPVMPELSTDEVVELRDPAATTIPHLAELVDGLGARAPPFSC